MSAKFTLLRGVFVFGLSVAAATEEAEAPVFKEVRIMAKVLEESLDRGGVGPWHTIGAGASFFEPRVRAQYIPTVGAIFTVPVGFPIVAPEPAPDASDSRDSEDAQDLWKRFENTAAEPGQPLAAIEAAGPDGDQRVVVRRGGDGGVIGAAGEIRQKLADEVEKEINVVVADEMRLAGLYGVTRAYDEERVANLRRAVIETVAQYAWRMENVPSSERVLVVIEAPRPRTPKTLRVRPGARLEGRELRLWTDAWLEPLKKFSQEGDIGRIVFDVTGGGARDRRLFSFNKSDLLAETTYDDLAPKTSETAY